MSKQHTDAVLPGVQAEKEVQPEQQLPYRGQMKAIIEGSSHLSLTQRHAEAVCRSCALRQPASAAALWGRCQATGQR